MAHNKGFGKMDNNKGFAPKKKIDSAFLEVSMSGDNDEYLHGIKIVTTTTNGQRYEIDCNPYDCLFLLVPVGQSLLPQALNHNDLKTAESFIFKALKAGFKPGTVLGSNHNSARERGYAETSEVAIACGFAALQYQSPDPCDRIPSYVLEKISDRSYEQNMSVNFRTYLALVRGSIGIW